MTNFNPFAPNLIKTGNGKPLNTKPFEVLAYKITFLVNTCAGPIYLIEPQILTIRMDIQFLEEDNQNIEYATCVLLAEEGHATAAKMEESLLTVHLNGDVTGFPWGRKYLKDYAIEDSSQVTYSRDLKNHPPTNSYVGWLHEMFPNGYWPLRQKDCIYAIDLQDTLLKAF